MRGRRLVGRGGSGILMKVAGRSPRRGFGACACGRAVPEGAGGACGGAWAPWVDFGPVAFERILGRREPFGGRPCAVMPLEPEPVSGGDLGGGRSS